MQRAQLRHRISGAGVAARPLRPPHAETRALLRNDLLMSSLTLTNGARRLVRHGKVPIHVRHVLDLLLGHVHAMKDKEFPVYSISAADLYRHFGVEYCPSQRERENLIAAVAGYVTVVDLGRSLVTVRWVDRTAYDKETATFHFRLSEQLRPFLLDLKKNYTQLRVRDLLRLKTTCGHQLYQIVSRFEPLTRRKVHKLGLAEFLDALHMPADHNARANWKALSRYVLKPARAEIAARTGLFFDLKPAREHSRARGPVVAVELSNIRYNPELVEDMERADDKRFDAYQRKVAQLTEHLDPEPEEQTGDEPAASNSKRVEGFDIHSDPFADELL